MSEDRLIRADSQTLDSPLILQLLVYFSQSVYPLEATSYQDLKVLRNTSVGAIVESMRVVRV